LGAITIAADAVRPAASATSVVGGIAVYVPLAGIIDFAEERARLEKEIVKTESYVAATMKKLQNESFVSRAPEEVVEAERQKVATSEASLERLRHTLDSISE
jgi:valyl-tRNA synthetase